MINLFQPDLGASELIQIANSFHTGWIGRGPKVAEFEAAWAAHVGVKPEQVVAVNCATEGLFQISEIMNDRLGLSGIDTIILPSIHFLGAANAIHANGILASFCDVDPFTLNADLECIIKAQQVWRNRAVILLHYGGVAQDLDDIRQWCDQKRTVMIEDAACAPATVYKGRAAGTWGHFGVWSFDAMKIMSTGDGGMVYCENPDDAAELRQRIYLGMDESSGFTSNADRWWEFSVNQPGRRAIMNDIAAGIGLEQLKRLPEFVEKRRQLAAIYDEHLAGLVRLPPHGGSYYFYWIQTPRRDELAKYLKEHGIYTSFRYYPLHWVFKTGHSLPGAEQAAQETLLLPLHQGLSEADVVIVCERIREFLRESAPALR